MCIDIDSYILVEKVTVHMLVCMYVCIFTIKQFKKNIKCGLKLVDNLDKDIRYFYPIEGP